ncbi:hypothetical protein NE237_009210 [Protea cynaroides]|uniref:Uncharacterized protein n=1 Tax=Protea cynaroides TaxID=273540 RepID=A0A9Q0R028_9MAGN|nr:hypothetical protein NE237_009210 [Protea cynaroides]
MLTNAKDVDDRQPISFPNADLSHRVRFEGVGSSTTVGLESRAQAVVAMVSKEPSMVDNGENVNGPGRSKENLAGGVVQNLTGGTLQVPNLFIGGILPLSEHNVGGEPRSQQEGILDHAVVEKRTYFGRWEDIDEDYNDGDMEEGEVRVTPVHNPEPNQMLAVGPSKVRTNYRDVNATIVTNSPGRVKVSFEDVAIVDSKLVAQGGEFVEVGKRPLGKNTARGKKKVSSSSVVDTKKSRLETLHQRGQK